MYEENDEVEFGVVTAEISERSERYGRVERMFSMKDEIEVCSVQGVSDCLLVGERVDVLRDYQRRL